MACSTSVNERYVMEISRLMSISYLIDKIRKSNVAKI